LNDDMTKLERLEMADLPAVKTMQEKKAEAEVRREANRAWMRANLHKYLKLPDPRFKGADDGS